MIKRVVLVVFLGLLYNPFLCFSQDSIQTVKDLREEKELNFQQYFFKALSEKSIKNYQKAIENLNVCNEILPNNVSVYFEFSKNYLFLNKTKEAKEYIQKALEKDSDNLWMLEHLVSIYKKDVNYTDAIATQLKVVKINPKKREELVRLYYLSRKYQEALNLMILLEKENGLSRNLKQLKKSLELRKGPVVKKEDKNDLMSIQKAFEDDRTSFTLLKKLLDIAIVEDKSTFHKYSKLAIDFFPAQPYVYLMGGKSLYMQKKFQEGIAVLESGIDFVIDNQNLEAEFYETMANIYDGLGNSGKSQEYRNKAKKLKSVK